MFNDFISCSLLFHSLMRSKLHLRCPWFSLGLEELHLVVYLGFGSLSFQMQFVLEFIYLQWILALWILLCQWQSNLYHDSLNWINAPQLPSFSFLQLYLSICYLPHQLLRQHWLRLLVDAMLHQRQISYCIKLTYMLTQ